ncbi:hypothetical protein AgCh_015017 [Apium graveolens]
MSAKPNKIEGNLWVVMGSLLLRLRGLQNLLNVDLTNYPQEQKDGAPLLPWILHEIQKKPRNHYERHTINTILPLSDDEIVWTPYIELRWPLSLDVDRPIKQMNYLTCLNLSECSDLKRLPDSLGDMKALKNIDACRTAIEKLPDSITQLKGLVRLELGGCKKLRKLPQDIGNMQGLQYFDAGESAIEQLPDSFGGLVNLVELSLFDCKKLRNLPNSICKLKLLKQLYLEHCSNLEQLPEQLGKMQCLEYLNTSYTAIEQVPDSIGLLGETGKISLPASVKDMNKLRKLRHLKMKRCIDLQSISFLASHLGSLSVEECPSLRDVPDLSMLKELVQLSFTGCNNLKSRSLEQSFLQVKLWFEADLPNTEVAEWFNYKSSGHTVSLVVPPNFESNFLDLALWVVYTCKASKEEWTFMRAVIRNDTEGITENFTIYVHSVAGKAQSRIQRIHNCTMKSGDRIKISIPGLLYSDYELKVPVGEVKITMCGVHVIPSILYQ